jgi:hypothetical protein
MDLTAEAVQKMKFSVAGVTRAMLAIHAANSQTMETIVSPFTMNNDNKFAWSGRRVVAGCTMCRAY